jgi:hypothetical protein
MVVEKSNMFEILGVFLNFYHFKKHFVARNTGFVARFTGFVPKVCIQAFFNFTLEKN